MSIYPLGFFLYKLDILEWCITSAATALCNYEQSTGGEEFHLRDLFRIIPNFTCLFIYLSL